MLKREKNFKKTRGNNTKKREINLRKGKIERQKWKECLQGEKNVRQIKKWQIFRDKRRDDKI